MKLIIQIPCYNEEKTLPMVLNELPKQIEGINVIETQIIDDGSTDDTVRVARELGVNHIVSYIGNKGLGYAFKTGIENALKHGADIVVNTDGDNQYPGKYIADLVKPIIDRKADIVIGNRQTAKIKHFSPLKKLLQFIGSALVRYLSETKVTDSVSGFRAYSRESLLRLNVVSRFSYVLDTIIQAGKKGLVIIDVVMETNPPTRNSRLFKNIWQHIKKSTADMIRIYAMYEPLKIFLVLSLPFLLVGSIGIFRFMYYFYFTDMGSGMIQSLVLSGISMTIFVSLASMGIIGDLIHKSRMIQDDIIYNQKINKYGATDYELENGIKR
ncbi:MAG: glycosyltransferase family 2 protein [Candidatus Gracilibacteria bacterium]|nr:glycosyltransferase family 2 protein [Candidatus Gracilibacteria bacterium]